MRLRDPLSLFLFLLVVESLGGLVKNATGLNELQGFHLNENIHFEMVQFTDDAILLCDGSWNNFWSLKAILRGFEVALRLRVHLSKRNLFGLNLKDNFVEAASFFLSCPNGNLSFNFFGSICWNQL